MLLLLFACAPSSDPCDWPDAPSAPDGVVEESCGWWDVAVGDHLYNVQGAVIGMAARAVLGRQMEGFHLVFVDTGGVHAVAIKTIAEEDIVRGERAGRGGPATSLPGS